VKRLLRFRPVTGSWCSRSSPQQSNDASPFKPFAGIPGERLRHWGQSTTHLSRGYRHSIAMSYSDKLCDPRWQKKRLEILERDGWKCHDCGSTRRPLHVHHCYYERGVEPWETQPPFLMTLCESCHEIRGRIEKDCRKSFAQILSRLKPGALVSFADTVYAVSQAKGSPKLILQTRKAKKASPDSP